MLNERSVETLTSVKMDLFCLATSVKRETAIIHLLTNIPATVQILYVVITTLMDGLVLV